MESGSTLALLVFYAAVAVFLFKHQEDIRNEIEAFMNNFPRGGSPRPPMHPSPADDSAILRRKRKKTG